jgi:hypothetical protein
VTAIRGARRYLPDRLSHVAAPHWLLDPAAGHRCRAFLSAGRGPVNAEIPASATKVADGA